jgi:replicative DNA helicase
MLNNDAIEAIRLPLEPEHFCEGVHGNIYSAILDLHKAGRTANPVTVKAYIHDQQIGDMTTAQYLAALVSEAVSIVNVPDYAKAIMDAAARRACLTLSQKLTEAAYSTDLDIMDQVDALRAKFENVVAALDGGEKTRTLSQASRSALDATVSAFRSGGLPGVDYGVRFLMEMIGPLLPQQLVIIGGGTKQGKSTLIEQMVAGAALNGHPVWIMSGEMSMEELAHRSLSRITDIQAWRQIRGKVSDKEYEQLEIAAHNAVTWQDKVFIRDDTMTLTQIERETKAFAKKYPNGLAVVDHIGLVEKDRANVRIDDVSFAPVVTKALKQYARRCRIPFIAAAQLKKNTFSTEDRKITKSSFLHAISRRPKAADLYGSCEKDANHIISPFRAEAILQDLEPADISEHHGEWENIMSQVRDKAEIVLTLSRHTKWPQRKTVGWNGPKTMFTDLSQSQQGSFL